MKYLCLCLIRVYQWAISPLIRQRCRFYPSCSHYAYEAFTHYGVGRGFLLTLRRLGRCHPWGGSGVDLVPVRMGKKTSHSCDLESNRHHKRKYIT